MVRDKLLLWVDDIRLPMQFLPDNNHYSKILVATNSGSAYRFIERDKHLITHIHLDNDLGEDIEGKDIFAHIEALIFFEDMPRLEEIFIHTSNPSAAASMMSAEQFLADMGIKLTRVHF
ncbi:hypothetical protein PR1_73 [Providencia phage vB_PreS_PR1]|uniref:Cyclic-phosphate processing Receiver domain-containing protein n=1 Tax=Providencia phage vB_PreS_PR1 TaxID=1931407 RepID=A0A1S6KV56_9CAUD|nr:hypothetical protein FDH30_gp142 [Providencia phage vB_PreS_PR1]AQT25299.1 hypothetical protein PR1_73 [Providencia phage vB_PreS_PR1]